MRSQKLSTVLYKIKAELGKSLDTPSTAEDSKIYQLIESVQQELADSYAWGFLKSRWDSFLQPGQRFQPYPTTLSPQGGSASATFAIDLNRPFRMEVKWNNNWQPVLYGIDEEPEFNYLDSDRGMVLDPVQRWQQSDETQFEVWPLPASPANVRFIQSRALTSLQTGATVPPTWNPNALVDLDDLLVVYHVATKLAAFEKKANAQLLSSEAGARLKQLLGANPIRSEIITIGRGQPADRKAIRLVPLVLVGSGSH